MREVALWKKPFLCGTDPQAVSVMVGGMAVAPSRGAIGL
jgi:hypothetical protein